MWKIVRRLAIFSGVDGRIGSIIGQSRGYCVPAVDLAGERGDQRSGAPVRAAADHELSHLSRLRDRLHHFGAYAGAVGLQNNESRRNKRSPV